MATVVRKVPESAAAVKARPSIPVGPKAAKQRQFEETMQVLANTVADLTDKLNSDIDVSIRQSGDTLEVRISFVTALL